MKQSNVKVCNTAYKVFLSFSINELQNFSTKSGESDFIAPQVLVEGM